MSIPLIQKPDKDDINTSIIAIKRNIERINMLLGLSNSEEIDTSKFATKDELQQAVTDLQPVDEVAVDNMHSVTSNAVAESLSYSETERFTGGYWIDGKPIYRKVVDLGALGSESAWSKNVPHGISNISTVVSADALTYLENGIQYEIMPCYQSGNQILGRILVASTDIYLSGYGDWSYYKARVILEYTKTTD